MRRSEAPFPAGPTLTPIAQAAAFHRDPLGVELRAKARFGPIFTLRFPKVGALVVVTEPAEIEPLLASDPQGSQAGEARRHILPLASPRSVFGGDAEQHQEARARIAPAFSAERVERQRGAMGRMATEHARRWPRGRPFRLLPRIRALVDDLFTAFALGIEDEDRRQRLSEAIGRMLWTPGNPPVPPPGDGFGLPGVLGDRLFKRRSAPVKRLLAEELEARRRRGPTGDDIISRLAETSLTGEEAANELVVVLAAGQEPPASALTSLFELGGRVPGVLERLEADGGGSGAEAVVKETLRLRPPAVGLMRRLTAARTISGHELPAGTVTMVPTALVHRDPEVFTEPRSFSAERWLSGSQPETSYAPFGGGARRCVGEPLAHAYLRAVVPAIVRSMHLRPFWPHPERMVVRGTIQVPHRSGLVLAGPPGV